MNAISNLLFIQSDESDNLIRIDAFDVNGWSFAWSRKLDNINTIIFSKDNVYMTYNPCCLYLLFKIDIITGIGYDSIIRYVNVNDILFQANRIIVMDESFKIITCYIDESF
jgi:hypothetical protein